MGRPPKPKPPTAIDDPLGTALTLPDQQTVAPVLVPLSENLRRQFEGEVQDTLARITAVQARSRRPDGSIKQAKFKAAVLSLWWDGRKVKDIARILGVSRDRVTGALAQMREDSELTIQLDRVHQIVVPLAVDNLIQGVIARDKDYTLKALDGTGIFRTHKTSEVVSKKTVFRLTVTAELPPGIAGAALPDAKPGSIVGAPSFAPPPQPKALPAKAATPVEGQVVDG